MGPRSNTRLIRFAILALVLIGCGYILSSGSSYGNVNTNVIKTSGGDSSSGSSSGSGPEVKGDAGAAKVNGNAEPAKAGSAAEAGQAVKNAGGQEVVGDGATNKQPEQQALGEKKPDPQSNANKVKATFVTLARNSDLDSISGSIRQVEDRFNHKYNYDWVFLNDKPFSEEFIKYTSALVSGNTKYGLIPLEEWAYPEWIDQEKAALNRENSKHIIYGDSVSYRFMCRYESGFFWRHELLKDYEYYWRVEPDIKIYCDIDYDIFKFMKDNKKTYGFTITLPEYKETIPTLWETTKKFISENKQYIADNNLLEWISNDNGNTYNGCHFWSNFEVASLDFWRSDAYRAYFDYLDHAGGFFYERWGDAPVHSIAAALFLPRDQIHFFGDVGYYHVPFHNCPISEETRIEKKCVCNPKEDFTWRLYSCTGKFHALNNLPRPKGWEKHAT